MPEFIFTSPERIIELRDHLFRKNAQNVLDKLSEKAKDERLKRLPPQFVIVLIDHVRPMPLDITDYLTTFHLKDNVIQRFLAEIEGDPFIEKREFSKEELHELFRNAGYQLQLGEKELIPHLAKAYANYYSINPFIGKTVDLPFIKSEKATILEAGVGFSGIDLLKKWKDEHKLILKDEHKLILVDSDELVTETLKEFAKINGIKNVDVINKRLDELELEENSLDAARAINVLHEIPFKEEILKRIHKALKENALFHVVDPVEGFEHILENLRKYFGVVNIKTYEKENMIDLVAIKKQSKNFNPLG